MYKIAVMGDMDSVLGFKALGLEVCPVSTLEEGREGTLAVVNGSFYGFAPEDGT